MPSLTQISFAVALSLILLVGVNAFPMLRPWHSSEPTGQLFLPGESAQAFSLLELGGSSFNYQPSNYSSDSLIFHAYNTDSLFLHSMWTFRESLWHYLEHSPNTSHVVFMSYGQDAEGDVKRMQHEIIGAAVQLNWTTEQLDWLSSRLHFIPTPIPSLDNWIPQLLANWSSPIERLVIELSNGGSNNTQIYDFPRLDAHWPWNLGFAVDSSFSLAYLGDGCNGSAVQQNVTGKVAFVSPRESAKADCPYFDKAANAQNAGAVGVIIGAAQGRPVVSVNCHGEDECNSDVDIPITMITDEDGELLKKFLLATPDLDLLSTFPSPTASGFHFGIDRQGRIAQVGAILNPSFQFYAWAAKGFDWLVGFEQRLNTILDSPNQLAVEVFDHEVIGKSGVVSTLVTLPRSPRQLRDQYGRLTLDYSLSCSYGVDAGCQPWDRIHQTFVECADNTSSSGIIIPGGEFSAPFEIGRWINPFGRGGRWLTDVSPLSTLLGDCSILNFTYVTTANQIPPFIASLTLRFWNNPTDRAEGYVPTAVPGSGAVRPSAVLPLFQGGVFNSSYNNREPIAFSVPSGTSRVELYTVISGHGHDQNNCAEFCVTSHHFDFVDGTTGANTSYTRTFEKAGTPMGCAEEVDTTGVVPNQYGTWIYGRDGWCDGRPVFPWRVDVTDAVAIGAGPSLNNTVVYYGLFNGKTPVITQGWSIMELYSYLVFFSPEAAPEAPSQAKLQNTSRAGFSLVIN